MQSTIVIHVMQVHVLIYQYNINFASPKLCTVGMLRGGGGFFCNVMSCKTLVNVVRKFGHGMMCVD